MNLKLFISGSQRGPARFPSKKKLTACQVQSTGRTDFFKHFLCIYSSVLNNLCGSVHLGYASRGSQTPAGLVR